MSVPAERLRAAYAYDLHPDLIAQSPVSPRDAARLLVYHRLTKTATHARFRDLDTFLRPDDLLVLNRTRVLPVRLHPSLFDTGRQVELFLIRPRSPKEWEALVKPGKRLAPGAVVGFEDGTTATIAERLQEGRRLVAFSCAIDVGWLERHGSMPLPPYIRRPATDDDRDSYQTIFADEPGAVAAPTAGLHFTEPLFGRLAAKGIERATLVLHVGPGTFRPVRTDDIAHHAMDREYYHVSADTLRRLRRVRQAGGRIVAVGTTSVRTLETLAQTGEINAETDVSGWTQLFIHPPYRFRLADALITNFHLPESTLLMLVSAFAGREETLALYGEAMRLRYRFYSYGDAMLIL